MDMASELRELPPAFSSVHTRCACSVRPGATAAPKPKSYNRVSSGLPRRERGVESESGPESESERERVVRVRLRARELEFLASGQGTWLCTGQSTALPVLLP